MNKIDAFFTMFSLFLAWILAIFLLPSWFMIFVYASIAAWTVGRFIGNVPSKMSKETDRDFLNEAFKMNEEIVKVTESQSRIMGEMLQALKIAAAANQASLARIDELMFKYCPEEMSPEQIANYEAHVGQISQQQEDEIERALNPESGRYNEMLAEAQRLIALDPMPDTEEGKRLLSLTAQLEKYEKLHFPFKGVKH